MLDELSIILLEEELIELSLDEKLSVTLEDIGMLILLELLSEGLRLSLSESEEDIPVDELVSLSEITGAFVEESELSPQAQIKVAARDANSKIGDVKRLFIIYPHKVNV